MISRQFLYQHNHFCFPYYGEIWWGHGNNWIRITDHQWLIQTAREWIKEWNFLIALHWAFFLLLKPPFLKDEGFLSPSDWTRDFRTRLKAITGHNRLQYKMLDQPACWILWLFARKTTLNRSSITTFISKALSRPSWKWVKEGHQGKGEDQSHSSLYIDGFWAKDLLMIAD